MDSLKQDLRYAFRSLSKRPLMVAVAALSLGLGVGANTAIWSAIDQLMIRPLPYDHADELVVLNGTHAERGWNGVRFSRPDLEDIRDQVAKMQVAGVLRSDVTVAGQTRARGLSGSEGMMAGDPERVSANRATAEFHDTLGVAPFLGRGLRRTDEAVGADPVVILAHDFWEQRTGGDPGALGASLLIDGQAHEIVGVLPEGFWFGDRDAKLWLALSDDPDAPRESRSIQVIGRLASGATVTVASAELDQVAKRLEDVYPEANAGFGIRVESLQDYFVDDDARQGAMLSAAAVALVLLIACANVANLLLAFATSRKGEVAVRRALGASNGRLARFCLTESLLLGLLGGAAGLALAVVGIRVLRAVLGSSLPLHEPLSLDGRMLMFTFGLSVLTGLLFGLFPTLQTIRQAPGRSLRSAGRPGMGAGSGSKMRTALVVGEVALALALLVSSTLLVRGFQTLAEVDMGFEAQDVLAMQVSLPGSQYPDGEVRVAFFDQLESALEALPGVESVGATNILPGAGFAGTYYGPPEADRADAAVSNFRTVNRDYFEALDIPVLSGRSFGAEDAAEGARTIIINRSVAKKHWPDGDPIGASLLFSSGPRQIIGVVGDTRDGGAADETDDMLYLFAAQQSPATLGFLVETSADSEQLQGAIQSILAAQDSTIAMDALRPLQEVLDDGLVGAAAMWRIFGGVAGLALLLALGGVYGVVSYWVAQRTPEFGLRMALGADRKRAVAEVLRHGVIVAVGGVAVGGVLAVALNFSLASFLYGLSPLDPLTFVSSAAALLLAVVAACWLPAQRAASIDPAISLRNE